MGHTHRYKFDFIKKNVPVRPHASKPDSDPPIGSDLESGCDKLVLEPRFRRFWISLTLRMYLHSKVLA